jgi:hypothetical protein
MTKSKSKKPARKIIAAAAKVAVLKKPIGAPPVAPMATAPMPAVIIQMPIAKKPAPAAKAKKPAAKPASAKAKWKKPAARKAAGRKPARKAFGRKTLASAKRPIRRAAKKK